ncbi:MAG: ABC transporter permease [Sarcina sp.]
MRNIMLILKNNLYRLKYDKATLAIMLIVTPLVVGLGIYFSNNSDIKGKIAVVGVNKQEENMIKTALKANEDIELEFLDKEVENTKLIRGEYIAQLSLEGKKLEVSEFSNTEVKNVLEALLEGKIYKNEEVQISTIAKIVGFLIMFLFFGAISVADPFLSDRENKVYTRVLQGNVSYLQYTIGQLLYIILLLAIPTMIISGITITVFNVNLGINMFSFMGIIFLVGLLSGSYVVLMSNIFKNRTAVAMNTSIISMITCLLSGCLISIDGGNKIVDGIRNLLPQKRLIDFANEFGSTDLLYVLGFIVIALGLSIYIGSKDYEKGVFL